MELVLVCVMVAVVAGFVTRPLRTTTPRQPSGRVRALEDARDAKLREIRDAELDLRTGKLEPADHRVLDARLRADAVALLRRLDEARTERAT